MPDEISIAFGRIVSRRRETLGWSQERLAHEAGIDRSFVSKVELGKVRLGLGIAKKVAAGFGTSLADLIAETEAELDAG